MSIPHYNSKSDEERAGNFPRKPIVIAGMGPGGLFTAIHCLKKGYPVLLFDNREHFSRPQMIKLSNETIDFLKEIFGNSYFIKSIIEARNIVTISELQNFLYEKIKDHPNLELLKGSQNEIIAFDFSNPNKNIVRYNEREVNRTVEFDCFVAADGAKRTMAQKFNEALEASRQGEMIRKKIAFKDFEIQTRMVPHGTVNLRLKNPNQAVKLTERQEISYKSLPRLKKLGWDEPFPPKCYVFYNRNKTQFYFGGEIPQSILDLGINTQNLTAEQFQKQKEEQRKLLVEWGKLIIELQHGLKVTDDLLELDVQPEDLEQSRDEIEKRRKDDLLKTSAFEVRLQYTDTPCVELNNHGIFSSIGDAASSPNFHFSHGANDAIYDARILTRALPSINAPLTQFDRKSFINWRKNRRENLRDLMEKDEQVTQKLYKNISMGMIEEWGNNLLKLSEPMKDFPPFKKARENYKEFFEDLIDYPEEYNLDEMYVRSLEFSDAINSNVDKFYEHEKNTARQKTLNELLKVQDKLLKINMDFTSKLKLLFLERTNYFWLKRDKKEREIARLMTQQSFLEEKLGQQILHMDTKPSYMKELNMKQLEAVKRKTRETLKAPQKMIFSDLKKLRRRELNESIKRKPKNKPTK